MRLLPALAAVVVAGAAGLGAATVVEAQTAGTAPSSRPLPAPPGDTPAPHRGPAMRGAPGMPDHVGAHGMRMMRELDRLRTSLKLDASQAAAWDKAIAAMRPAGDPRAEMRSRHERLAAALDDPNFDPRKLAAEMDRSETEQRARMSMIRESWFAVYDTLNPVQRGQVREFLREKLSHGPMTMHGPMEWRHRGEHEEPGRMPPPAGAAPTR